MIRLRPLLAGAGELVARPVVHGRTRGLSRLTAPTHSPWFWLALWTAAAATGFVALIPVLFDGGPVPGYDVINRLAGISFVAWGLVAWRRRPDSAVGRLLTLAGFGVLLSPVLDQVHSPVAFTTEMLFIDVWNVAFVALLLSFVTGGRLQSTVDAVIVGTFVVASFVLQFSTMLFVADDHNLLLVHPDAGAATALNDARFVVFSGGSLAVVVVLTQRWRSASRPRRRVLLPSLGGILCAAMYTAWLTSLLVGSPVLVLVWLLNAALLTIPAALAWGLLRSRLARGGLAELFRELGTLRGPRLEEGLARTLGDPGLVPAYPVPGGHAYVDGRAAPVALPAPGDDRVAVSVERDGRELGLLVYDASLDEDPEL